MNIDISISTQTYRRRLRLRVLFDLYAYNERHATTSTHSGQRTVSEKNTQQYSVWVCVCWRAGNYCACCACLRRLEWEGDTHTQCVCVDKEFRRNVTNAPRHRRRVRRADCECQGGISTRIAH